ncbi:MAG: succinic semialdehyde dehydrogenase [Rubricoccaceae bacterium]|nr:succinic semialdehyde dehydrogenase [Rubricoccaceae bacterium]
MLATAALDAIHIGNGHVPTLPANLTPERLRDLARIATYAPDDLARERLTVRAPFTGETVASLPAAAPADVQAAFAQAREAQAAWAARPYAERARIAERFHDLVLDRHEQALDLIQLESGKTRYDAFQEVGDVAVVSRYYAYHGEKALARSVRPGFMPLLTQVEVNRLPLGVVGIIAPWNYPLTMAITDAIPALLAGNAVVVKPAELTPFTALWAAALLLEAGLPEGLLHVVPGSGEALGETLLDASDFVHFTGSTEVGRLIARQAGERLIGASLELGGKNPLLVLDDADLGKATEGAVRACFSSAGQLCIAAERLYVDRAVFDDFLDRFRYRIEALTIGAGYDWATEMGSLVSQEQLDKVTEHVEDALSKGATLVTGGHPLPHLGPYFYAPTVLTDVTPEMTLFREETFGPVVAVYPFDTDAEAVALANDSPYGLNASVWTRDTRRGRALARQIRCGTVGVNDPYMAAWGSTAAPMGGFGDSGQGRRHGAYGIQKYTEPQTVATQHLLPIAPLAGMAAGAFAGTLIGAFKVIRRLPGLR